MKKKYEKQKIIYFGFVACKVFKHNIRLIVAKDSVVIRQTIRLDRRTAAIARTAEPEARVLLLRRRSERRVAVRAKRSAGAVVKRRRGWSWRRAERRALEQIGVVQNEQLDDVGGARVVGGLTAAWLRPQQFLSEELTEPWRRALIRVNGGEQFEQRVQHETRASRQHRHTVLQCLHA